MTLVEVEPQFQTNTTSPSALDISVAGLFRVHGFEEGSRQAEDQALRDGYVDVIDGSLPFARPDERILEILETQSVRDLVRRQINPAIAYSKDLIARGFRGRMLPHRAQAYLNYARSTHYDLIADVHSKDTEAAGSPNGEAFLIVGEHPSRYTLRAVALASQVLRTNGNLIIVDEAKPLLYGYAPWSFGIEIKKVNGEYPLERLSELFYTLMYEDHWKVGGEVPKFNCYRFGKLIRAQDARMLDIPMNNDFLPLTETQCNRLRVPSKSAIIDWMGTDAGCDTVLPEEQSPQWDKIWDSPQPVPLALKIPEDLRVRLLI